MCGFIFRVPAVRVPYFCWVKGHVSVCLNESVLGRDKSRFPALQHTFTEIKVVYTVHLKQYSKLIS